MTEVPPGLPDLPPTGPPVFPTHPPEGSPQTSPQGSPGGSEGPTSSPGPPIPRVPTIDEDRAALSEPQRMSPLGPLFVTLAVIRAIGTVNIGVFGALILAGGRLWLAGLALVAILAAATIRWWRFRYYLDGDEFIVESGLFSLKRATVPLERVQSVSTRQNLLHRMSGLVEAQIETAGSAGSEVALTAVDMEVARSLRRLTTATATSVATDSPGAVATGTTDGSVPAPPMRGIHGREVGEELVLHRSPREIIVASLLRNPLAVFAGPFLIAVASLQLLGDLVADQVGDLAEQIFASTALIVLLVVVAVIVGLTTAVVLPLLMLYDLTLTRTRGGLRMNAGLINKREKTVSIERIQMLVSKQNIAERRSGIESLQLPTAGRASAAQANTAQGRAQQAITLPGTTQPEADAVRELLAPGAVTGPLANGISPAAVMRWTMWLGVGPAVAMTVGLWFVAGPWALLGLLWVIPIYVLSKWSHHNWRWELTDEVLRIRKGRYSKTTFTVPVRKTQAVQVVQGIFHRRRGLANLLVSTATSGKLIVLHLPLTTAQTLRDELIYRAETDPRPFM